MRYSGKNIINICLGSINAFYFRKMFNFVPPDFVKSAKINKCKNKIGRNKIVQDFTIISTNKFHTNKIKDILSN